MKSGSIITGLALAVALSGAAAAGGPSEMRVVDGQSFWTGDPGPINDSYWTSGQYKYDPNGYLERNWFDPEYRPMTVIGPHDGKTNCVFRQRVVTTTWDFQHPILRICRQPPNDAKD